MKKRLLCLCLALVLLCSALPIAPVAALYDCDFDNHDVTYPVEGGQLYFDKDIGAIIFCDRTVTSVDIPAEIDGVPVTKIIQRSFHGCENLTSVTIPETVTYIGDGAFKKCKSLTSVDLPDSLRHLGKDAFDGTYCTVRMKSGIYLDGWLLRVAVPTQEDRYEPVCVEEGTVGLACGALNYESDFIKVFDINLPASLRYISPGGLSHNGSVRFSEDNPCLIQKDGGLFTADGKNLVHYIPQRDQYGKPLPYYIVPEGVETIEDSAFESCYSLKIVSLPDSLVTIGNRAFRNSGLQEISFGKNVKTIGDFAFDGCNLNYVNLGESVETVGIYAFHENESLQAAVFPATVKSIGEAAFYNCTELKSAYFAGDVPTMGEHAFCFGPDALLSYGYYSIYLPDDVLPGLKLYYREGKTGWSELTDYTAALWEQNVHVHGFRMKLRQPSCTEDGWVNSVCACGEERQVAAVHSLAHQYDVWNGNCYHCGKKDGMTDVNDGDWFAPSVYFVLKNGLMNGVSEFVFSPGAPMTRAMLVTVLWRYEEAPDAPANTFSDVKAGAWYADAVSWAASTGVVNGVGNNKFDPEGNITREQMAAILYRYCAGKGIDTNKQGSLSGFPDAGKVSSYAKTALQWTVAEGIIGGSEGKLLPQGNATRAQVATILMRFIENIAEQPTTETPNELNMYMFGNSILYHGQSESIGWSGNWGMAASSAENDYAHRLNARLAGEYGQVSYAVSSISTYETAIVAQDDADYSAALASYTEQFRAYCAEDVPEIVTIQMGENVSNTDLSASQYKNAVMQLISMVRTYAPDCGIVLCTPFWGGEAKILAVEQIAAEADNVQIARLDTLNTDENKAIGMFEHAGVAAHPNDAGMERIAALIFNAMEPLIAKNAQPHEQS